MIEALEAAQRFVAGRQRQDLDSDEMLRLALTRALEVVGEAAGRVSRATRARAPDIPWRQLAGMRNRLIHAYFDVDRAIVWNTANRDVPEVLAKVRLLLEES
ncbi:MAG TPA: HepT-like ribonuclease domain-containing protein [Allosphingosinicella sp.]|nr:HepT-like ribonuclease domain-containing protein [Allosphingosinicella sp.]